MAPIDQDGGRAADKILLMDFPTTPCIVVKDPRFSLLLPFWLACAQRAGMRPVVVIAVRSPAEVARSLSARDGLAPEHSIACWMRYMLDSERFSRGLLRVFVDTAQFMANPEIEVLTILRRFGITDQVTDAKRISGFIDAELFTRSGVDEELVSPQAEETAQILLRLDTSREGAADQSRLDALREELDRRSVELDEHLDRFQWEARRRKRPLITWLGFKEDGIPRTWLRTILFQGSATHPRRAFGRLVNKKNGALRPTFHRWVEAQRTSN